MRRHRVQVTIDRPVHGRLISDQLAAAARAALAHQGARSGELTILVSGDEKLAELNQRFLQENESTDVLAFPAGDAPAVPDMLHYWGDIAISLDRAEMQAAEAGHSTEHELQLLVVHGTLHLLGHDHDQESGRNRMWQAQREILRQLGIPETLVR